MCFVFFGTECGHLFGADFPSASMFGPQTLIKKSLSQLVFKMLAGFRRRDASSASALALSESLQTDHGPSPWEVHGEGL